MKKLAIVFPGIGYHCDKPLLYYARKLAAENGYEEQIALDYSFSGNIRGDKEKMKEAFDTLYAQAENSLSEVDFSKYDDVLFISKSIGTIISSCYAKEHGLDNVRHILYTPLVETYKYANKKSIAFLGNSDPWSIIKDVESESRKADIPLYMYDDANHSLETEDTLRNAFFLIDVLQKTNRFIQNK